MERTACVNQSIFSKLFVIDESTLDIGLKSIIEHL